MTTGIYVLVLTYKLMSTYILTYGVGWHDWCSGQNSQKQFMVIVFWMAGINTICKGLFEVCGICKFKGNIFLGKL